MKINEVMPIKQVSFVVEVFENGVCNMFILRSPNGAIIKVCSYAEDVVKFLGELEFPTAPVVKL